MDRLLGFQIWLEGQNRKPSTIRINTQLIDRILREHVELTSEGIGEFFFLLRKNGARNGYINCYINALRLYGKYLNNEDLKNLKWRKEDPFVKAVLSDEEIESILALPPPTTTQKSGGKIVTYASHPELYKRWTLFFSCIAFSGCRPSEIANLTVSSVDFGRNMFILEDTKTNEPRLVPIAPNIIQPLKDHIASLQGEYLFACTNKGKQTVINNANWSKNFHLRLDRLGIKRKNLSVYSLRHSMITRLIEEDVSLFRIQKLVGHHNITTTAKYVHLASKDMEEALKKHPMVRRSTDPQSILRALVESVKSFKLGLDDRFTYELKETEGSLEVKVALAK